MVLSYAPLTELRSVPFAAYPYPAYPIPYGTVGYPAPRPGYVLYQNGYPWWGGYPVWTGWHIPNAAHARARASSSSSSSSSTRALIRV